MTDQPNLRVRYRPNQILRRQDFEDEQAYHLGQTKAHNLSLHGAGVVEGLFVQDPDGDDPRFRVTPGKAIATDGMLIELSRLWPLETETFDRLGVDRLNLYLQHQVVGMESPLAQQRCPSPSGPHVDREQVDVMILCVVPNAPNRKGIYLGQLIRDFSGAQVAYSHNLTKRLHTGLVGASIQSPSQKAKIELGELNGSPNGRRFAILLKQEPDTAGDKKQNSQGADDFFPAVEIDGAEQDFAIHFRQNATVSGDLRIRQGGLVFDDHADVDPSGDQDGVETDGTDSATAPNDGDGDDASETTIPERAPRPWTIYRAKQSGLRDSSGPVPAEQLRIELDANDQHRSEFTVGTIPPEQEFQSILKVTTGKGDAEESPDNLGQVVIKGDLIVEGRIQGQREESQLSEQAREMLFSGALIGPQKADELIQAFQRTGFLTDTQAIEVLKTDVEPGRLEPYITAILSKENGIKAIAEAIKKSEINDAEKLRPIAAVIYNKDKGDEAIAEVITNDREKMKVIAKAIYEQDLGDEAIGDVTTDDLEKLKVIAKAVYEKDQGDEAIAAALTDDNAKLRTIAADILSQVSGADAFASQLPDNLAKLQTITQKILTLGNGDDAIANELPDDLPILQTIATGVLALGNGDEAVANSLPDDLAKLQTITKKIFELGKGDEAIANELPDDLPVLQTIATGILALGNGDEAVANSLPDDLAKLQTITNAILALGKGDEAIVNELPDDLPVLQTIAIGVLALGNGDEAVANSLPDDLAKLETITNAILALENGDEAIANELPNNTEKLQTIATAMLLLSNGDNAVANSIPDDLTKLATMLTAIFEQSKGGEAVGKVMSDEETHARLLANAIPDMPTRLRHFATALMNGSKVTSSMVIKPIIEGLATNYPVPTSPGVPPENVETLATRMSDASVAGNPNWKDQLKASIS